MSYSLTIPVEPVPGPRPKMTRRGRVYYPKKYLKFKGDMKAVLQGLELQHDWLSCTDLPVYVSLECIITKPKSSKLAHPKPDIDNYVKSVLDACNGWLWKDDSQVTLLTASKRWADGDRPGCVHIVVHPIQ